MGKPEPTATKTAAPSGIIAVTAKKDDKVAEVEYNFGVDLKDACEKFTDEVVFTNFRRQATISLQALMRRHMTAGSDPAKLAEACAAWKPGVQAASAGGDIITKFKSKYASMSAEDKKALLAELNA